VLEIENAEELLEATKIGEMKYLLVNIVGKRARVLNSGDKPLVDVPTGTDLADVVLAELHADKLILGKKKPKSAAPPPPPRVASEEEE
jgi:DNA-directed RNA polymerase subunit K/omega